MKTLSSRILERASQALIFQTKDMAQWLDASPAATSRALGQLQRRGLLTRVTRSWWADSRSSRFSPHRLVPLLTGGDADNVTGYVTVVSAMAMHGMISQIPAAIHVAVRKQRRALRTPVGNFVFHQIAPSLFDGFEPGDSHGWFQVATPTKAVFDALYLSVRRKRQWRHLPEVDLPRSVTDVAMQRWIARLPTERLRTDVDARWKELRERSTT